MGVLRGFLSFIINIIIFCLLFALSLSYCIKGFVINDLLNGVIKDNSVSSNVSDAEVKKAIKNIVDQKEINDLLEDLIDEYVKYTKDKTYRASKEFKDKIIDFMVKNKDSISKLSKEEVTIEKIRSEETYNNLTKALDDGFIEAEKIIDDKEVLLDIYTITVSTTSRVILISIITLLIILLALINWSFINWIPYVSVPLIFCGSIFTSIYILIMKFSIEISNSLHLKVNINPKYILLTGLLELVIGILMLVIKSSIKKMNNKVDVTY